MFYIFFFQEEFEQMQGKMLIILRQNNDKSYM